MRFDMNRIMRKINKDIESLQTKLYGMEENIYKKMSDEEFDSLCTRVAKEIERRRALK